MATQASAITFLSTPGQAYVDGMRFVQFYLGLPLATVVLSVTLVPLFHRLKVSTAYEFLEARFDLKTRLWPRACSSPARPRRGPHHFRAGPGAFGAAGLEHPREHPAGGPASS